MYGSFTSRRWALRPLWFAREVQEAKPDAIVLAPAAPEYRREIMDLANETLILHPVTQRYRDHHGYPESEPSASASCGGKAPELIADGALVGRSATPAHLALQRALQRDAEGMQ